jgi:starch synthase
MKTVFVSSEVTPFASTGGLADVAAALPAALQRRGIDTVRVMPYYRQVDDAALDLEPVDVTFRVPVGMRHHLAEIWVCRGSSANEPDTYLIRRDEFFDRRYLYGLPYRDYEDNFERFIFFQKAAVMLLDALEYEADIVHCNDWQTGLLPMYLTYGIHGMGRTGKEKTVFTIHNLAYQGLFDPSAFSLTNLPLSCFSVDVLEFYGKLNCLKGGITTANRITTVSPTYAQEIQTSEFGCGLEGVLQKHSDRLTGILNGVDYSAWNPESDPALPATYSSTDLAGKKECKEALCREFGLKTPEKPLIGIVSRLTEQKGFDILSEAIEDIMELDVSFVLLGTGDVRYHELAQQWADRWPGRFGLKLAYDVRISHLIEGGADLFLMPSRFEPCGLNQLYSLRYGTLPVVHATGGLNDTIGNLSADSSDGSGFVFNSYSPQALYGAVQRAVHFYANQKAWQKVVSRVMNLEFSWDLAAATYENLYETALSEV